MVAAAYVALPACEARTVQAPVCSRVTRLLPTLHTLVVSDANVTFKPDDAVAEIVNGGSMIALFGRGLNVMVSGNNPLRLTLKLRVTGAAGA